MTIDQQNITKRNYCSGFTIVELLVVIVVIGILAAITIVAYRGISQRAAVSSLQTDLTNVSRQLKLFQIDNSVYPTTINCALPDSAANKCVKASSGNTFSDFQIDNSSNPQSFCLTSTNTNGGSYRITEDGTSKVGNCSRQSCYAILNANESYGSGIYWIKPAGTAFRVYCDMDTSGGGWTLLVTNPNPNSYPNWNMTTIYSLNSNSPSISSPYSILNQANSIKSNISGNLQYRIDAESFGHWGGVWKAPFANTFVGTSAVNNATNIEQYDVWTIDTSLGTLTLTNVMPWVGNTTQLLSTWGNAGSWYGTLVTGVLWGGGYTPYIYTQKQTPNIIWYWVK